VDQGVVVNQFAEIVVEQVGLLWDNVLHVGEAEKLIEAAL